MIELFGAALVLLGSAMAARHACAALRQRVRLLEALCLVLSQMRAEIGEKLTPLPELMQQLARTTELPLQALFQELAQSLSDLGETRFSALWERAVKTALPAVLTEPEERALLSLGSSLGCFGAEPQCEALFTLEAKFRAFAADAEKKRQRDAKLYAGVSLSLGALLVIFLL